MSMAVFAGMALTACGNEPEPLAPVEPSFDRATESTDADERDGMLQGTPVPETQAIPPVGSQPGEIPEVMQERTPAPGETGGDTTTDMLDDPVLPDQESNEGLGTPQ
ncbi:MAG: hypothetical protein CVT79_09105 [Alphaproteobacteria bacterium HGW-Alphaproteobacteria-18]|nr:MAG: hypothetical protein CVT79_09105 [Alphaproteobacteria bacterium HGW-Alphaproteobacteria-18]